MVRLICFTISVNRYCSARWSIYRMIRFHRGYCRIRFPGSLISPLIILRIPIPRKQNPAGPQLIPDGLLQSDGPCKVLPISTPSESSPGSTMQVPCTPYTQLRIDPFVICLLHARYRLVVIHYTIRIYILRSVRCPTH